MKYIISSLTALIMTAGLQISASAKTVAFGYISNKSGDINYEYMETILPNSLANSLQNEYKHTSLKPAQVSEMLKKPKLELKKAYKPSELPGLMEKIKSDIFISGNFTPRAENEIEISLLIYFKKSNEVFKFTSYGRIETEIFKLVDRISYSIARFIDREPAYRTVKLDSGSSVALLTNLESEELNTLYMEFLSRGYKVSAFQASSTDNPVAGDLIDHYKYIYTENNFFGVLADQAKVENLYSAATAEAEKHYGNTNFLKDIYLRYDLHYTAEKEDFISTISQDNIDALLIIGFNGNRKRAWIRCLDLKKSNLVWVQSDIRGRGIGDVGEKIINILSSDPEEMPKNQKK